MTSSSPCELLQGRNVHSVSGLSLPAPNVHAWRVSCVPGAAKGREFVPSARTTRGPRGSRICVASEPEPGEPIWTRICVASGLVSGAAKGCDPVPSGQRRTTICVANARSGLGAAKSWVASGPGPSVRSEVKGCGHSAPCSSGEASNRRLDPVGRRGPRGQDHRWNREDGMRSRGLAATHSIERISAPSRERFYTGCVTPARPVIIERAIAGWRATTHWSEGYLKAVPGHRRVPVEVSPDHEFAVPGRFGRG